jgi:hypothetical protein
VSADVHFLAAVPYVIPDRQLLTFPCLAGLRLVRCAICSGALAVLWGRPVRGETDLAEAFAACRGRIEDLVRRLLAGGRGAGGGLVITAEDVDGQAARALVGA